MAELKVLTVDGAGRGVVPTAGTQVTVGGQKIDRVQRIAIEAQCADVWTMTLTVHVDPNTLFGVLPAPAPLATR